MNLNSQSPTNDTQPITPRNWKKPERIAWMSSRKFSRSKPLSDSSGNLDLSLVEDQKLREVSNAIAEIMVC